MNAPLGAGPYVNKNIFLYKQNLPWVSENAALRSDSFFFQNKKKWQKTRTYRSYTGRESATAHGGARALADFLKSQGPVFFF
jgi:hypothetical protein